MKNLKVSKEISTQFRLQSEDESLLFSAFDVERNRLFFASSANVLYAVSLSQTEKETVWRNTLLLPEAEPATSGTFDCISTLEFLMEKEAVVVGTSNGYLIQYIVDCDITEVVGRVDGGIKCISCSPDGALLAVIAGQGQLLVMTQDWEVLCEVSLEPQILIDSSIDGIADSSGRQFGSNISWRGDGKYFATISGPCESHSLKQLKIWERDSGVLHATTESDAFVGEGLSWMPSGAKIVTVQDRKTENSPLIVIFEKNGLERSSFSIEEATGTIVEVLKWNCSSDLLAACVRCKDYDAIKVWSFCNYHWYMKQEIRYSKVDKVKFEWAPTKSLHLISWTLSGKITTYNFIGMTAVSETSSAFVIDGTRLLVSPLDISLIPPPMSLFNLKFPSSIQEVAYHHTNCKSYLAVCLSDGNLGIVEFPPTDTWEDFEGREFVVESCHFSVPLGPLKHLTWLDSHILVGVCCCSPTQSQSCLNSSVLLNGDTNLEMIEWSSTSCLKEIELECSESCLPESVTSSGWHVKKLVEGYSEKPIIGLLPNPAKKCSAFVQLDGGSLLEYSSGLSCTGSSGGIDLQLHTLNPDISFSSSCPWMKAALVCNNDVVKPLVLGLDDSGKLQINGRVLSKDCSSFSFYSDSIGAVQNLVTHLILTTKHDLLFVFTVDGILLGNVELQIESITHSSNRIRKGENKDIIRIWERGSKLAGVVHGDEAAIILQAIRGNLECIYPRKLVLVAVANALTQQRLKDAMLMVRRHRIDFNVIVDYCGLQTFLKSAGLFVSQISNLGHVTEFVCAIKNENVIDTLYKDLLSVPSPQDTMLVNDDVPRKVSSVLLAIRKALEELVEESPARELCILTTLARSEPPELEECLRRIKTIRDLELAGAVNAQTKSYPSAEEALKHLLWLSNAEAVYDAALGLYDLNLASIVALNSDKDPKEFLPFLRELEQMSPVIMQYTIDLRLHHYEGALRHLASAGDNYFDDCMTLMKQNAELFPIGLQLFTDQIKRTQVLEAWGDNLHGEKCFEDAASTYMCCSSFHKALKAYRAYGDWKGTLSVAGVLQLKKEEILQLGNDLCDELQALGQPVEAAKVALEYCLDVASGVGYYVTAREWQEALRVAYLHNRMDLVTEVTDAASECASTLINEFKEGLEKVGKYVARYLAVRQRRLVLAAKIQAEDRAASDIEDDNISETSSNVSGMSAYTTGSMKASSVSVRSSTLSKSKEKKRQRNRGKIRAGSPGEELALIEHLKGMSLRDGAQRELKSLLLGLLMLGKGKEETARQLQRVAISFHLTQVAAVKLAEDLSTSEKIDESIQTLDNYLKRLRESSDPANPSWQVKVLSGH